MNDSGTNSDGISLVNPTIFAQTNSRSLSFEIRSLNLICFARSSETCGIPLALIKVLSIIKKSRGMTIGTTVSPSFHCHSVVFTSKNLAFTVCKKTSELNLGTKGSSVKKSTL